MSLSYVVPILPSSREKPGDALIPHAAARTLGTMM